MKYIFIAGLEHSGTTLTDYLLSQTSGSIGLGEVSQFFSNKHMQNYIKQWGDQPDVELCSCKKTWSECLFWGDVVELNGLNSNESVVDKHQKLFKYIQQKYGKDSVVIDSSKNVSAFQEVESTLSKYNEPLTVHIVFTCKDVRSFAMSILRKQTHSSLFSIYRSFNWWASVNKQWLDYLDKLPHSYTFSLYEKLCESPQLLVDKVIGAESSLEHQGLSHIAMGNKKIALRNTHHITYEDEWSSNWKIKLVYFFMLQLCLGAPFMSRLKIAVNNCTLSRL